MTVYPTLDDNFGCVDFITMPMIAIKCLFVKQAHAYELHTNNIAKINDTQFIAL